MGPQHSSGLFDGKVFDRPHNHRVLPGDLGMLALATPVGPRNAVSRAMTLWVVTPFCWLTATASPDVPNTAASLSANFAAMGVGSLASSGLRDSMGSPLGSSAHDRGRNLNSRGS